MATAKKTPSGMWRIRCFDYQDESGKKHYKSFTEPTKALAEQRASAFNASKKRIKQRDLTCSEALTKYLEMLPQDTSPSTMRGYISIQKRINADSISGMSVNALTDEDLQMFVHRLNLELSAKSVKNTYSLLMSAVSQYNETRFRVKLPKLHRPPQKAPSDSDIKALISAASPNLRKAIYLAAFGSMRRGEAAAVKYSDIDYKKNTITVHADIVLTPEGKWFYKSWPKTNASYRTIEFPKEIIKELGDGDPDDYIVRITPGSISDRFYELKKKHGFDITYHGLRHYCASIMAALGISDSYAKKRGGWSSTNVLKSVYQNVISEQDQKFTQTLNNHFKKMLDDIEK